MGEYSVSQINLNDKRAVAELDSLLMRENIRRDANLEYTAGIYDDEYKLIATGSCYANTLRCLAVDSALQGEGLMNLIVSNLVEYQMSRGNSHLFIYTKCDKAALFNSMGFYEIANVDGKVSFMENRKAGFAAFLENLAKQKRDGKTAAVVVNCNPFTLGHRYLIEKCAAENDIVHVFVVSENASLIPFADRYAMVKVGCADLENVILHKSGSYMISNAVFPSYFLADEDDVIHAHTSLDTALFIEIAKALGINRRYVGEEPTSRVTNIYNSTMLEKLPEAGIECIVIPRKSFGEKIISASNVRQLIHDDKLDEIRDLVPPSTFDFFKSDAGAEVVKKIKAKAEVKHY